MALATPGAPEDEMRERWDSPEELERKVERLAEMIRLSQHTIAFTGTAASHSARAPGKPAPPDTKGSDTWTQSKTSQPPAAALPTPTHMALCGLEAAGYLHHLSSQSPDGLHRRSGFPLTKLSELAGNGLVEECESCGQQYLRDFTCTRRDAGRDHATGRRCVREGCHGRLLEWTIDPGQPLPERDFELAEAHAREADLCLSLGSSLIASPTDRIPARVCLSRRTFGLVIVSLHATPLTDFATMQIYAECDAVMKLLMHRLRVPIPPFVLRAMVEVRAADPYISREGFRIPCVHLRAVDTNDPSLPLSTVKAVRWASGPRFVWLHDTNGTHSAAIPAREHVGSPQVEVTFSGHFSEPPITLELPLVAAYMRGATLEAQRNLLRLSFDPAANTWHRDGVEVLRSYEQPDPSPKRPKDNRYGQAHLQYCSGG